MEVGSRRAVSLLKYVYDLMFCSYFHDLVYSLFDYYRVDGDRWGRRVKFCYAWKYAKDKQG